MGDRKPSQFVRHLRGLAPDVPKDFLYTIRSSRLPPNIQTILGGQQECSFDAAVRCADRISEVAPQPALASVGPPRRIVPRRKERADYDFCAANDTTIHTYGWLPLSLNLGLRRYFT
jgi:hypothetical protein